MSTYATWWIRQSIGRAIDDLDRSIRLPVHFLEFIRRYRREVIEFERSHQRPPLYHEIASILHISDKDVAKLDFWNRRIMSLHAPIGDDDTTSIGDYLVDDADISQTVEQIDLAENIQRVLQSLTDRERTIITLRFGLDGGGVRTLEEIGTEMGITRERVRQIESKTLADLRKSQRSLELYIKG